MAKGSNRIYSKLMEKEQRLALKLLISSGYYYTKQKAMSPFMMNWLVDNIMKPFRLTDYTSISISETRAGVNTATCQMWGEIRKFIQ
jgi:hypothetical protein